MNKKNETNKVAVGNSKEFFINYGIFVGILVVVFAILIHVICISRVAWNNNLKYSAEKVLEENDSGIWSVGSPIDLNNAMSLRSGCFGARNRKTGEMYYVFITRVPTFYGPMGAVFTCSLEGEVSFHGYSSLHGRILKQINQTSNDKRLEYFAKRIPAIIGISVPEVSDQEVSDE